jgi:hypothetical protein
MTDKPGVRAGREIKRPGSPFWDRLPARLVLAASEIAQRPDDDRLARAIRHGLDIARRAQLWEGHDVERYNHQELRSLYLKLAAPVIDEYVLIMRTHGYARRVITCTALHYGLTDPLSPGYHPQLAAAMSPRLRRAG